MTGRDTTIAAYVAASPWAGWDRRPLAGDASNRRYFRLYAPGEAGRVVLMDAPPERGEDVRPFVRVARHLAAIGLGAPDILAQDIERGLLILEDLGDELFARILRVQPDRESALYAKAVDTLIALHRHPAPADLPRFAPPLSRDVIAPAWGWYRAESAGIVGPDADPACAALNAALLAHADDRSVMILRDFHAENLLWRADQAGLKQVGLIDFQDALAGHPAYDLVSLLEDARRDVPADTRDAMIARYIASSGVNGEDFRTAFAVLGAQRNLRILGVFARLCLAFGKARYVDLIPRVWAHLMGDLAHPALDALRPLVLRDLPEPTTDHLNQLRDRCATLSTR